MTIPTLDLHQSAFPLVRLRCLGWLRGGAGFPDSEQGILGEEYPFFKVKHLNAAGADGRMGSSDHSVSKETAERLGAFVFPRDSIVFAKIGAALMLNRFRFVGEPSCIDNNMMGFVLDSRRVLLRYVLYALSLVDLAAVANPGAVPSVSTNQVGDLVIPVPPLEFQRAIADYLDRETAQIDVLIAAKERALGLLAEKRRALITRAVTRGLDPHVSFRDSGIPWLGEIPEHWEVVALRFLVDLASGATPNTGRAEYWDGEIPWVSPKDIKRDEIEDAQDHVSELALSQGSLHLIEPGAVLIVVRGMILAHSFPTAITTAPVTINQDMKALRCRGALIADYLRDFLRGYEEHIVSLADSSAHGTRKLETEVLGRLEIAFPPEAEQRAIATHIRNAVARLDAVRSAIESTIALLKERRAALIAAAVSGQIDVGAAV